MKFVHTADTHLGFEITKIPQGHPQGRQRRADSILRNFEAVVRHALDIEVDFFLHSGDLFNKYYIPQKILEQLIQPLLALSRTGIRVLLIPGNHEKSEFPFDLFHGAPGVVVFDCPKSVAFSTNGYTVGFAGLPFIHNNSCHTFLKGVEMTEYTDLKTDLNILVTHQAFDGASVGPVNFIFRAGRPDTVSRRTLPLDFDYIAAGHIHRYQVLPHPLNPEIKFVYPGSIQRISFAEMYENKGFVEGEIINNRIETRFVPLPVYHMQIINIEAAGMTDIDCRDVILAHTGSFSENTVVRFNLTGGTKRKDYPNLDLQKIRAELPPLMESQFALKTSNRWILQ